MKLEVVGRQLADSQNRLVPHGSTDLELAVYLTTWVDLSVAEQLPALS